jgi:hypothetical protein
MSTNFYLHKITKSRCPTCGHDPEDEPLHIGKSSWGWCFSLHVYPEKNIIDLYDWKKEWSKEDSYIENEYKDKISPEEMFAIITERGDGEYCSKNSKPTRHIVDGKHCIGWGEGTFDYMVGEFS